MAFNKRGLYDLDNRNAYSGKDCSIFDSDGNLLSTVEQWQADVNFANATYQPLGSPIQQEFMTGYGITIAITNIIVEDDDFIRQAMDFFTNGRHAPSWILSSVIHGYNGSESRIDFHDCVPSGSWNLHNFTAGDIIRRTLNLHCNQPPFFQKTLSVLE